MRPATGLRNRVLHGGVAHKTMKFNRENLEGEISLFFLTFSVKEMSEVLHDWPLGANHGVY